MIDAQKIFMTAFIKKLMSIEGISKLNDLVKEINANLNTNVSLSDALYFATNALDLDLTKVVMLTMPGTPAYINNVSYYLVNKTALIETFNTYLTSTANRLTKVTSSWFRVQARTPAANRSRLPISRTINQTSDGFTAQKKITPEAITRQHFRHEFFDRADGIH